MSKVTIFYLISSKFFVDFFFLFWEPIFFPHIFNKDPPAYYFFDFLDLITGFLDLKRSFLDFLDLKTNF